MRTPRTRTPDFLTALDDLATDVSAHQTTAIMCSESVWWRCHRRLIADAAALLRDIDVAHLAHDGRTTSHEPSAAVRLADDFLHYDAAAEE